VAVIFIVGGNRVRGENHIPAASHWESLSHNVVSSTPRLSGIRTHNGNLIRNSEDFSTWGQTIETNSSLDSCFVGWEVYVFLNYILPQFGWKWNSIFGNNSLFRCYQFNNFAWVTEYCFNAKWTHFSDISCREQATYQWADGVRFVLYQDATLLLYM